MRNQLAMPAPDDFCTVAWAAELCNVSQRTIRRAMLPGEAGSAPVLDRVQPLVGSGETGRRHTLLLTVQVREYAEARRRVGL